MSMRNLFKDEKSSPWVIFIVSFLAMILIIQILSWQYKKIEKEDVSNLEQRVEKVVARETLKDFLRARIEENEVQAKVFLAEPAMEDVVKKRVELLDNFKSYDIIQTEKKSEKNFVFLVKLFSENGLGKIEQIELKKILGKYYVNSIKIPG